MAAVRCIAPLTGRRVGGKRVAECFREPEDVGFYVDDATKSTHPVVETE